VNSLYEELWDAQAENDDADAVGEVKDPGMGKDEQGYPRVEVGW